MSDENLKKLFKDLFGDGDDKANVQVRVIRVMKENIEDDTQEEPKPEPTKEPSPERAGDLILANIRFAKAMKNVANEFYQLSCLADEILKENQELRTKLGEKQ